MLRSLNHLRSSAIAATDGDIGTVHDLFFDDHDWVIRYFVVNTGSWLQGRHVLISPTSIRGFESGNGRISVNLSCKQVQDSPDVDTHKPVSRQMELKLAEYYAWPMYWTAMGMIPDPVVVPPLPGIVPPPPPTAHPADAPQNEANPKDSTLRSVKEVSGYCIEAADGSIGHVDDFIGEDANWTIRYLVIDTRNWWPGKKVLISPRWIRDINWNASTVRIDLQREVIKHSPEYDPASLVNRDYELRLHAHYGRPKYWD